MPHAADVVVVTSSVLEGWVVDRHIGPVSIHLVAGTNIFSDILASWSDVFGGRSGTYGKQLARLYAEATEEIRRKAAGMGANAVIGLHIDFDELSAQGKSMFMLNALGTAVVARRTECAIAVGSAGGPISGEQMDDLVRTRSLLAQADAGQLQMTDEVWQFITARAAAEFSKYVLSLFAKSGTMMPDSQKLLRDQAVRYFNALSQEEAKERLYNNLGFANTGDASFRIRDAITDLVHQLHFADYALILEALASEDLLRRKHALSLHTAHPFSYREEDLDLARQVLAAIPGAFPDRWNQTEIHGMFGRTKPGWTCPCGGEVPEGRTRCPQCLEDRHGFSEHDVTIAHVTSALKDRIAVLEARFSAVAGG